MQDSYYTVRSISYAQAYHSRKHQSRQTLEQENVKEDMKEHAEAGARGERAFHVKKYSPCRSTRSALTHTRADE